MKQNIIHNLPGWCVTSYGNGLAYEVAHKPLGMAIFFQGDDAAEFRDTLDGLTEGVPSLDYCDALAVIWSDYFETATQWRVGA